MATRIVLNNALVTSSSSKAGKPKGSKFVLGKGLKIELPSSEASKILDLVNKAKTFVATREDAPESVITVTPELVKFDTVKKVYFMFLNLTKVPQEKNSETYLTNEDGSYQEQICNYLPNEDEKFVAKMPTVIFNGEESQFLPFAGSIVDVVLLFRTNYDKEKLNVKLYVSVDTITVVKPAENQTGGSNKPKNIEEFDLGEIETEVETKVETAKIPTAKKSAKKEETAVTNTEVLTDIF